MYSNFSPRNRQVVEKLTNKIDPTLSYPNNQELHIENLTIEEKYKDVSDKLRYLKTKNQSTYSELHKQAELIQDNLYVLQHSRNKTQEFVSQLSESFDRYVHLEQTANSDKINGVRRGMIEDIERKKKTMKTEAIQALQSDFQQISKANLADLEKKMGMIQFFLQEQRVKKEESAQLLAKSIGEKILGISEMIAKQREERIEKNKSLFDMISQTEEKLRSMVHEEVKCRQKGEQIMQGKLEQICHRIEERVLGSF